MSAILVAETLDEHLIKLLSKKHNSNIDFFPNIPDQELSNIISEYDAIIVRNRTISRELLQKWRSCSAKKLCITRAGSNTSTIDVKSATEFNIQVMNTAGANAFAVSQFIFAQILHMAHGKSIADASSDINNGVIKNKNYYKSFSLKGSKLALIGTGYIGSMISKIASSFGITVMAYSPSLTHERAELIQAVKCDSIEDAMKNADILTVQVPYKKDINSKPTYKMINYDRLNLMNEGSFVSNISRKDIIDMDALEKLYLNRKFSGIALDILTSEINEITSNNPNLLHKTDVLITPLIATETEKCEKTLTQRSIEQTLSFLNDQNNEVSRFFVNKIQG